MGGSGLKKKSSKRKSDNVSSQKKRKKKGVRKDSKKRRRIEHSVSSRSTGDLSDSEYTSSPSTSLSGYNRKRTKSKKRHRANASVSSDTNISRSTDSDSLSSDDKTHKTKKARKSRILLKSKKRTSRKRFSSSDDETYAKNVRKRKRSGKDLSIKSRKKPSKKKSQKKLRSDSESYSTSPSSKSTEDDKHSRKKSGGKEIERWASDISYKGRKKRKVRSPSCSSFSRSSSDKDNVRVSQNKDVLALLNNNPRRLRSIISIPDRTFNEVEKDFNKEEIVHDRDDYPSPKSLDSDEEQNKVEPNDHSQRESIVKFHVEKFVTEFTNSANVGEHINKEHGAHIRDFEKEIDSSASMVASGGDLELTLRQKALENLMKFRGGHKGHGVKSHGKSNNEIDVINDVRNESKNLESSNALEMEKTSGPTSNEEFSQAVEVEKCSVNNQQEHLQEDSKISTNSHPDLAISSPNHEIIQGPEASYSHDANKEPILGKQLPEEPSLEEHRNESSNVSEFEEKTMSVMRGGEMVQVSYKVYIPKKTPRLARRQLRR